MKRNLIRIAVMLVVVVGAIISAGAIIRARNGKEQKVEIKTAKVERSDITSTVSATGVLQPLTLVDVKSNVGGKVEQLTVEVGDQVKKGQLIARIDPTDSQTQFEQAKANLDRDLARRDQAIENLTLQEKQSDSQIAQAKQQLLSAQARLRQAQNQYETQPKLTEASINQAKANLASARETLRQLEEATIPQAKTQAEQNLRQTKSNMETAEKNLNRQKELLVKGFVPASTVDTAESQYQSTMAAYEMARRKSETVNQEYAAEIRSAQARVAQAEAQLDTAERNRVQNDIRRDEYAAAKASVEQAKSELTLAYENKRQILVRQKDVVSAKAAIISSQASLTQAAKNLTFATILAPRDGIVLQKTVEEGTVIAAARSATTGGGTNIVQLGDISRMFVLCQVDETDIGSIEVGQAVDITIDAYPSEIFDGKVTRVDPQAKVEQNVTTIPVTVEIDSPDLRLKPAMNASCEFVIAKHENVLAVPNEAVKEDNGENTVTVMQGEKRVDKKVQVGIAGADMTEIREGLKEGETVVTAIIEPEPPGGTTGANAPRSPFGGPFGGGGRGFGGGGPGFGGGGPRGGSGGSGGGARGGGR